jgi:hypothetical protein
MLFMIGSIIVLNLAAFLIPKKLSKVETYVTSFFSLYLALFADSLLGGMYKLYAYFEPGVDYIDFVAAIGIYPAVNIIFLNLFPYKEQATYKITYIVTWSLFALGYEWFAATQTALFTYTGWKTVYSTAIYPILFLVLLLNLYIIRKLITKSQSIEVSK